MTNKYCDSPIHKVSSLALAFIILAFCVLPSFASADSIRPNEPVGYKDGDTFRDILLAVLDSWGISFSKRDSSDDTSILEYSDQLMQEFYEDNNTSQELFWELVQYGANETGNIILDFLGVNKIRQFANWLVDKYNLSNNQSTDITPVPYTSFPHLPANTSLNTLLNEGIYFYNGFTPYAVVSGFTYNNIAFDSINFYPFYYKQGNSYNYYGLFITSAVIPNNAQINFIIRATNNTSITRLTVGVTQYATNKYYFSLGNGNSDTNSLNSSIPIFTSLSSAFDYYSVVIPSDVPPIIINTTVINIPSEDFDPSDGLQIQVPGTNWGDSIYTILDIIERLIGLYDNTQLEIISIIDTLENLLENLQHSVTVENIPGAVTLDYDDYDIPLENEWGLFDIFFNTGGDSITLLRPWQELRSIIYGFPTPVLSFFALVVLFIVAYGFIRMGRDSH